MAKLISLKLDKKESKKESPEAREIEGPRYPYGTSLYLDEVAMEKLGIAEMPEVGEECRIVATAKVTGTSSREYDGGSHKTLDIQLTEMSVEWPSEKDGEEGGLESAAAKKLYPKG